MKKLIEGRGWVTEDLAGRIAHRRVQGMAVPRREEIAEHFARVGIRDDTFPVQVIAQERSDHDVKGPAPVQALQGGAKASRQLLHPRVIGLRRSVALPIVVSRHGTSPRPSKSKPIRPDGCRNRGIISILRQAS